MTMQANCAVTVPDRDDWFEEEHGFPHPLWRMIDGWMRVFVPREALHGAWQQFVRHWLERVRACLNGPYTVEESPHFHYLSDASKRERTSFIAFLESARSHIRRVLADIGTPDGPGKHVVLRFTDMDDYYRYLARYAHDGEQAMSGGVLLHQGYLHIAFPASDRPDTHRHTCVHELTHNLVAHLPLPAWLNEALAMGFEADLGSDAFALTHELVGRHRGYWNSDTIQTFWQGIAFHDIDGQEVAYSLAQTLLQLIQREVGPAPEDFRRFVLRADASDAGAVAAREHLGVKLEELVSSFLGPGEWAPRPKSWQGTVGEPHETELDQPSAEFSPHHRPHLPHQLHASVIREV